MSSPSKNYFAEFAFLFLGIVLFLLFLRSDIFLDVNIVPINDYASNDLLIQDAVDFKLFHGNYSRVGFYHPGPFFFQLMAVFEILFYRLFRVFSSPMQSHIFAVLCLNALSWVLLYFAFVLTFGNRLAAFLAVFFYRCNGSFCH